MPHPVNLLALTKRSASATRLADAMSSVQAKSAVISVSTPGVFVTLP